MIADDAELRATLARIAWFQNQILLVVSQFGFFVVQAPSVVAPVVVGYLTFFH